MAIKGPLFRMMEAMMFVVVLYDAKGPFACIGPPNEHSIEIESAVRNQVDLKPGQKMRVVEIRTLQPR
jgi:hypothetical protein